MKVFRRNDDRGASAVEYGLLIAGVSAVVVAAVFLLGIGVNGALTKSSSCFSAGAASTC